MTGTFSSVWPLLSSHSLLYNQRLLHHLHSSCIWRLLNIHLIFHPHLNPRCVFYFRNEECRWGTDGLNTLDLITQWEKNVNLGHFGFRAHTLKHHPVHRAQATSSPYGKWHELILRSSRFGFETMRMGVAIINSLEVNLKTCNWCFLSSALTLLFIGLSVSQER